MLLRPHATAQDFLAAAQAWLMRDESANNLLLSFASRRAVHGAAGDQDYYATIAEGRELCLAATAGQDGGVLLGGNHRQALRMLARDLAQRGLRPQGVVGEAQAAADFATCFAAATQARVAPRHRLKHLALYTLPLPPVVAGGMRDAGPADLALVEDWWEHFREETRTPGQLRDLLAAVASRIPGRGIVLWCAPEPIAMAAYTLLLPDTARLSAVFTARGARQQGYASALVAQLSRQLMLRGTDDARPRRACFLSTDAHNPVSNAIYERIGFREQGEHQHLDFVYAT
ncbi:MAG: GNAT family N-acetyltransferase [Betaproteobacteria bacterium]|nr:GNAT family N-acetyltransferase [Betaproteobacteria bacterium]